MLEKYDEAIKDYEQAITYDPQLANTYDNLGSVLTKKGDL